jgi:hypothetical protein
MDKRFIIELPHLEGIIDFNSLLKSYDWNDNKDWPWRGIRCYEVFSDQPEMQNFISKYHVNEHYSSAPRYWLSHKPIGVQLWPHTDDTRDAALIFPIIPESHTLHFLADKNNEDSIIYSHKYRCPGIPNSKIVHTAHDKDIERYYLQISLYFKDYNWNDLSLLVASGEVFA